MYRSFFQIWICSFGSGKRHEWPTCLCWTKSQKCTFVKFNPKVKVAIVSGPYYTYSHFMEKPLPTAQSTYSFSLRTRLLPHCPPTSFGIRNISTSPGVPPHFLALLSPTLRGESVKLVAGDELITNRTCSLATFLLVKI